ncbi:putative transcriptional regulatory protein -like protein [Emericellopsis cladophorae]|uniref:Transcriptional regulatory protein -like protein n=1 Tax=Emericellopsis cladophorae TaxID=2686198 RepID=A0A9Q0BGE9_9HYPO|nr:putative transcriptional regulatory protein -like protein [Emericellopsis cladophorae]KAI6784952.1 putative transcriptional regulatory protein -like protein [Emericellopsis cladophorae]
MRRPKACATCRARRRKCVIEPGQERCEHCITHNTECVQELPRGGWYEQRALQQSQQPSQSPTNGHPSSGAPSPSSIQLGTPLPGIELILEIVHLYFDYIHDQFHCLFHRPTFIQDVTQGHVPEGLLFGILGLAARFCTNPALGGTEPRDRGRKFMLEAEKRLNIRHIHLDTVRLAILVGAGATGDGDTEAENIFYTVACRMARMLGMPHRPAASTLDREIEIRVWWSLCMSDVWSSTAVKLPRLQPVDGDGAPLPSDDLPFLHLQRAVTTPAPLLERRSPLISQMILLNRILLAVNDFNQACVSSPPSPVELENGVQLLVHQMESWLSNLPRDLRDNADNFRWFNLQGLGRPYAAVYLGYYHFGQLLYYQFLHVGNGVPAGSPARVYSDRCKYHSAQLCDMIYRAVFTPGSDVRYHMVAHVLVIASTVQIHTLLFSDDETQIADARRRLEKNFEILLLLRPYWPALDRIMGRLRAFHATCQNNMSSSFVLDRWMLQFLVNFGGNMDEKPDGAATSPELEAFYSLDSLMSSSYD